MPTIISTSDTSEMRDFSERFAIKNTTRKTLKNAALAWLDYDNAWRDGWGEPMDFPKSIAPGKTAILTVKKKVRIVSLKIKWHVDGRRNLIELDRAPSDEWCYFTYVELAVDDVVGNYFSRISWERVSPPS